MAETLAPVRFSLRLVRLGTSLAVIGCCLSCSPRNAVTDAVTTSNNLQSSRPSLPGTSWKAWRAASSPLPDWFLSALDNVVPSDSEGKVSVLRARGRAVWAAQSCFPFENSHQSGKSLDLAIGDWNEDGRADLLDACLLASALEAQGWRGALGVYGHRAGKNLYWVHADAGGSARWGGMRNAKTPEWVQPVVWARRDLSLRARCREAKVTARDLRVVVAKEPSLHRFDATTKTLTLHPGVLVYAGKRLIKAYPAALGFDPIGDKQKRDDYRTPEGEFYLCGHNARSRFHRSLRLSYPNAEDAARGLRQGLIDQSTHRSIVKAIRRGEVPPQNTRLGGDIMIHGGGIGSNWTWGCVALENQDVEELFDFLKPGTRITVWAPRS